LKESSIDTVRQASTTREGDCGNRIPFYYIPFMDTPDLARRIVRLLKKRFPESGRVSIVELWDGGHAPGVILAQKGYRVSRKIPKDPRFRESCQAVVAGNVLKQFPAPKDTVLELAGLLVPNGILVMTAERGSVNDLVRLLPNFLLIEAKTSFWDRLFSGPVFLAARKMAS
jgi:hypothetical protein